MWSSVKKAGLKRVVYIDGKDRLLKIGGSRAWRYNNPGNIKFGKYSRRNGSIGSINGFAVFPTEEVGDKAKIELLKGENYIDKTISGMVEKYAPKEDDNNPEQYKRLIERFSGLKRSRRLKELSNSEFGALIAAMKRIEGYAPGKEERFRVKNILDVRVNKRNVIIAYMIDDLGWLSKAETIKLIEEERVDAVVVTENGRTYIRTRPDQEASNNLDEMKPAISRRPNDRYEVAIFEGAHLIH